MDATLPAAHSTSWFQVLLMCLQSDMMTSWTRKLQCVDDITWPEHMAGRGQVRQCIHEEADGQHDACVVCNTQTRHKLTSVAGCLSGVN